MDPLLLWVRTPEPAAKEATQEHEAGHLLWVFHCIADRIGTALGDTEERKAIEASGMGDTRHFRERRLRVAVSNVKDGCRLRRDCGFEFPGLCVPHTCAGIAVGQTNFDEMGTGGATAWS